MTDPEPQPGRSGSYGTTFPAPHAEKTRDVVVVRRRRSSRQRPRRWAARASMRRTLRTMAVCGGVLLLMAAGLYFGLARQETAPEGGSKGRAPNVDVRIV